MRDTNINQRELHRIAQQLLEGAPDHGARGEVEVKRYQDERGRYVHTVNQFSGDGGWSSPQTHDLAAADLAAEILALTCGATLIACKECDAEGEQ